MNGIPLESVSGLLKQDRPRKWIFYGDSITHGAYHTFGHRDYAELFAERVRFEMARTSDIVITSAISGDTTRGLISGFDWRVGQFKPDVVFIMIGMNDCSEGNQMTLEEFRANLVRLDGLIRGLGAVTVLQTTCPIIPGHAADRFPYFDGFMEVIRAVATEAGIPMVDHLHYWRERPECHFQWMNNEFHPNHYGHRAFARCLFESLGIWDPSSPCGRLFVP